jgi:hypothetical protein
MLFKFTKLLLRNTMEGELTKVVSVMVLAWVVEMESGLASWCSWKNLGDFQGLLLLYQLLFAIEPSS